MQCRSSNRIPISPTQSATFTTAHYMISGYMSNHAQSISINPTMLSTEYLEEAIVPGPYKGTLDMTSGYNMSSDLSDETVITFRSYLDVSRI